MYKVHGHIVALAINLLLAGPVKMELLECILLAADQNEASGAVVDHDGMAVIDDVEWRRLIVEAYRGQLCFLRVADVDGGLVLTILAGRKPWFQVTPMTRSTRIPIIPIVLSEMLLGGSTHRQGIDEYDYPGE